METWTLSGFKYLKIAKKLACIQIATCIQAFFIRSCKADNYTLTGWIRGLTAVNSCSAFISGSIIKIPCHWTLFLMVEDFGNSL